MKTLLNLCVCSCLAVSLATAGSMVEKDYNADEKRVNELSLQVNDLMEQIARAKAEERDNSALLAEVEALRAEIDDLQEIDPVRGDRLDDDTPGGEDCTDATDLGSALGSWTGSTTPNNLNDYGPYGNPKPDCWDDFYGATSSNAAPDVTYKWTAPSTGEFTFHLCGSGYDTGIALYYYTNDATGGCPGEFICGNDDDPTDICGVRSALRCLPLADGDEVLIVVDGYSSNTGSYTLTIEECDAPPSCDPPVYCGDPIEIEPNDTCPVEQTLDCGDIVYGFFCADDDETDFYRFAIPPLTRMTIRVFEGPNCDINPTSNIRFDVWRHDCVDITNSRTTFFTLENGSATNPGIGFLRVFEIGTGGSNTSYKVVVTCEPMNDCICEGEYFGSGDQQEPIPDAADVFTDPCDIPDGITHTITVPEGTGTILDVNVEVNILHGWVGDLFLHITHDGVTVNLKTHHPTDWGESCDNLHTTWDDEGEALAPGECPHFGCTQPFDEGGCGNALLSAFNGMDAAGDWTIYVADGWPGDSGLLVRWGLCLETELDCEPVPASLDISPDAPLPYCECLFLCPDVPTPICVGPGLGPHQQPIVNLTEGCLELSVPQKGCEYRPDCPPIMPLMALWQYNAGDGTWCTSLSVPPGAGPGCVCFCLDGFLPVELNEFTATAGDGEVSLAWSTASEINSSHFEIVRDGDVVNIEQAHNSATGANYSWTDRDVVNGREYRYSLVSVDLTGTRDEVASASATPTAGSATVTEYALHQNYPNPFNPATSIAFDLVEDGPVMMKIYNALGQEIATLANGTMTAGQHVVSFDAGALPSGLYFYRLEAGDFTAIRKMILMK